MENDDNDDIIPTLVDETAVLPTKVPVTILTGYLGIFFDVYIYIYNIILMIITFQ